MDRGHVLVMSLWDDHDVNMLWLDSDYPLDNVAIHFPTTLQPVSAVSDTPEFTHE